MSEASGDQITTPIPTKPQDSQPTGWRKVLHNSFRNPFGAGTEPHWEPPVAKEERTAQSSPDKLASRITALSQPQSDEAIDADVIAGRNVRAALIDEAKAQRDAAERSQDAPKADALNEGDTAIISQPTRLTTSEISNQSIDIKNPRTRLIDDARAARVQPIAQPEAALDIKPAEQLVAEVTAPAEEPEPWKPVFSQALMDSMVPRSPASGKTYSEIEQERASARTDAAIARVGESKVDEVIDRATRPNIGQRLGGALRGGLGRRATGLQTAIASTGILPTAEERAERDEDRAGEANIQSTLRTIAAKTADELPIATTAIGMNAEQTKRAHLAALARSYDRSPKKGATESPVDPVIAAAQTKIARAVQRAKSTGTTPDANIDTPSTPVTPNVEDQT